MPHRPLLPLPSGHINISEATYTLLKHRYGAVPRGEIEVKGKGKMNNYYLLNMPVEQQQGLAELAAALDTGSSSVPVVDRWARTGENTGKPASSSGPHARISMIPPETVGAPGTPAGLQPMRQTGGLSLRAVVGMDERNDPNSKKGPLSA